MLFDTFATLDRELARLESMLPAPTESTAGAPMDVRRESDRYVVEMDLPGLDPSAIDITVEDGWLSVKADRSGSRERKDGDWVFRERSHATVVRGFSVDPAVDADAIVADYANGVLTLTLPLAEQSKPRKVAVTGATTARELGAGSGTGETTADQKVTARAGAQGKAEAAHSVAS